MTERDGCRKDLKTLTRQLCPRLSACCRQTCGANSSGGGLWHRRTTRERLIDYLKTPNGEREVDLPTCVARLLLQFIGNRKRGLLFCNRRGQQLDQRNVLRLLHKALEEIGFEQAGAHAFRRYRNTFLRNHTYCPESVRDFWLGWGAESMSDHYDGIKSDVAHRQNVTEACGVGFDVPATLGAIEPIEPKLESYTVTASA